MSSDLSPGFADPVTSAQACFRAVLDAMAHPGRIKTAPEVTAPAPLCAALGAVLLTLVDPETPLWLDPEAAAARAWIGFHTGPFMSTMPTSLVLAKPSMTPLGANSLAKSPSGTSFGTPLTNG